MILAIPTDNPETAEGSIELVGKLVNLKGELVRSGMDAAFATYKNKLKKWKEEKKTWMEAAREMLQTTIDTFSNKVKAVLDANTQVHTQRMQQAKDILAHKVEESKEVAEH